MLTIIIVHILLSFTLICSNQNILIYFINRIISEARDMTEFPDLTGSVSLRELQFDRSSISKIPDKFCDMVPAIQRL